MNEGEPRILFRKSLAGRLLLFGVLPMVVVDAAIIAIGGISRFHGLRNAAEASLRDRSTLAAAVIEDANNNGDYLARSLAQAQEAGLFGQRRLTLSLLGTVLEQTPWCSSTFVAYEPDSDGGDKGHLEDGLPKSAVDAGGRFIPRWRRDATRGGVITLKSIESPDQDPGVALAKQRFRDTGRSQGVVTALKTADGERLIAYTHPIVLDGTIMGVAGVDRPIAEIRGLVDSIAERAAAKATLLGPQGQIVVTSGEEALGGDMKNTAYAPLFQSILRSGNETTLERATDPVTQEDTYFVSSYVPTGGWRLVLARPTASVMGPIKSEVMQVGILAVSGLTVVFVLLVALALRFSRSIRQAVLLASRVAKGDLTAEVKVRATTGGEAQLLAGSLCQMTRNLDQLVTEVKQAAIRLHATATQVAATSSEQERSAQEFARNSSEIATAVREITRTGEELVGSTRDARKEAEEAASVATNSREALERMENSMRDLDSATGSVAEKLAAINEKASGITAIVETIQRVADQTNLLSVNAAIEAEKAGESGRGFLVVAREIRRLADQTAAATVQIDRMVTEMQSAVSTGVMEMDRFADQVRRGVAEVDRIGNELSRVIEQAATTTGRFTTLDEGVAQQTEGAKRIDEAMVRLSDGARQTQASISEFGQAANGLQQALASLRNVVGAFRLRT